MYVISNHPTPRTEFLTALSARQRFHLTMQTPQRSLRRGACLFAPGDEADGAYVIQAGRVKISRYTESGREVALGILEAGELIGLEWLQGHDRRLVFAEAMEETRVLFISRERMENLLHECPELSLVLMRILGEKLQESQVTIERLLLKDVKARLASLLLDLAERCGLPVEDGVCLGGHITHQDMANLIGSTRETTTALLNQFKRHGVIDIQRRRITIAALDGLQKLAC